MPELTWMRVSECAIHNIIYDYQRKFSLCLTQSSVYRIQLFVANRWAGTSSHMYPLISFDLRQISMSDRDRITFDSMSMQQREVKPTDASHSSAPHQREGRKEDNDNCYYRPCNPPVEKKMGNEASLVEVSEDLRIVFNEKIHRRERRATSGTVDLRESFDSESDDESKQKERSRVTGAKKRSSREACWGGWIVGKAPFSFLNKQEPLLVVDDTMDDFESNDADFSVPAKPLSPIAAQLNPNEVYLDQLWREGARLERQGSLDAALDCYMRYLEHNEMSEKKAGHGHYLVGVVQWKRGEYEDSLLNLSEALQIYKEAVLDGDFTLHDDIIEVMLAMSKTYLSTGNRRVARKCSKQALHFLGTDHVHVRDGRNTKLIRAKVLHSLGTIDANSGDIKSAMGNFNKALSLQREVLGRWHVDVAATLLSFGSLYEKLGRYTESQSYYLEAFTIYRSQNEQVSSSADMGVALTSIGWIRYLSGDYQGALRLYQNALAYFRLTLGNNHRNVASVLIQMGMAHTHQGNLKQALRVYKEALRSQREALGDDHEDVALSLCHMGSTLEGLGDLVKALQCVNCALLIYTKLFGTQHLHVALTLVHLASLYQQLDDNTSSMACYMDALNVYKAIGVDAHDARVLSVELALQALQPVIGAN